MCSEPFSEKGAFFDDLTLLNYTRTLNELSDKIYLLSPKKTINPYYATFGWVSRDKKIVLPNDKSIWSSDKKYLTPETLSQIRYQYSIQEKNLKMGIYKYQYLFQ